MGRDGVGNEQSAPDATGSYEARSVPAYAAAILAFAYAVVSLYWAVGGHALVSTVGGYVEQFARRGGALPVLAALGALVLSGVIHPAGSVDRTALRWHVGVWDLWFLVWGILLALATLSYRRTVTGLRPV
jgi:hypothetical protein